MSSMPGPRSHLRRISLGVALASAFLLVVRYEPELLLHSDRIPVWAKQAVLELRRGLAESTGSHESLYRFIREAREERERLALEKRPAFEVAAARGADLAGALATAATLPTAAAAPAPRTGASAPGSAMPASAVPAGATRWSAVPGSAAPPPAVTAAPTGAGSGRPAPPVAVAAPARVPADPAGAPAVAPGRAAPREPAGSAARKPARASAPSGPRTAAAAPAGRSRASSARSAAAPIRLAAGSVDPPAELVQALELALRASRIRSARFRDPLGAVERLWWAEERAKALLVRYPDSPRLKEVVVAARTYRSRLPPTPPPPTLHEIGNAALAASFLLRRGDVELARERAAWASACADHLARRYLETDDLRWLRERAHALLDRAQPAGSRATGVRLDGPGTPCM
ncbi:MAG TPA: hypothetical protein VFQ38_11555 [Longimicrobiales bacterium]|nr:hypothetical protein [Longimicrobiales bacterium]